MKHTFMQGLGLVGLLAIGAQILAVPRIQQVQVTQQAGSSCGYHAVINATAVDTLAWQDGQLTSAAIVQEGRQYRHLIQRNAILGDVVINLANQLDIQNLYCVNGRNGLAFAGASQDSQEGNQFLNDVVAQRHNAHPMIGHFVVNTGGHWVVFSVVKQPGQDPTIVYMDSVNTPLSRNRVAQAVGNTLLVRLGGVAERVNAPGARGRVGSSGKAERIASASAKNTGKSRGRAHGNSNTRRSLDKKRRSNDNFNQSDYEQEYTEQNSQLQKASKDTWFSYKTYLAVGLVGLVIGLSLK